MNTQGLGNNTSGSITAHPGQSNVTSTSALRSGSTGNGSLSVTPSVGARLRLYVAGLVMVVLTIVYACLATWTANPQVVSPSQVALADVIIVGKVEKTAEYRFRVERVLKGPAVVGESVRVLNVSQDQLIAGTEFLLLLSHFRRDYEVTVVNKNERNIPPVVLTYPVTSSTLEQVKRNLTLP